MWSTHFSGLVLCDFVLGVFLAVLALAVGSSSFRDVDLVEKKDWLAHRFDSLDST